MLISAATALIGLGAIPVLSVEAASAALPDGRAYEQASPVNKNGANAEGSPQEMQAARDGNRVVWFSQSTLPNSEGAQTYGTYLSSRSASGWETQGLLPPPSTGLQGGIQGWGENLGFTYLANAMPSQGSTFYTRNNDTHQLTPVSNIGGFFAARPQIAAASSDETKLLFESHRVLTPEANEEGSVYLWDQESETLVLASVLNDGTPPSEGAIAGAYDWELNELSIGGAEQSQFLELKHVLSTGGSKVVFTARNSGRLYVRENPLATQSPLSGEECTVAADACTIEVSAPEPGVVDPNGPKPAAFQFATPDGSKIFFTSHGKLTADATTGPADEGNDLYSYDTETHQLTDITVDGTDAKGAEVQGVIGTSDDGSSVYFVANGVLANGAAAGNCEPQTRSAAWTCNIYLWQKGKGFTFVAPVRQGGPGGAVDGSAWLPRGYDGLERPRSGWVSSNGETLVFRSVLQQTAYDNEGLREYYRYRAGTSSLTCITCGSGDAPAAGSKQVSITVFSGGVVNHKIQARNMSSDGDHFFFETGEKLVAADTNGDTGCPPFRTPDSSPVPRCQDVYEWEAKGSGSCQSENDGGGCFYLISSGTSPEPSFFLDASANGNDVFFFTSQSLVGQDTDQLIDVYDARVGGGIAAQNPPPETPCLSAESCKGSGTAAAAVSSPGTATFSGPGNPKPRQCPKGRKKQASRCVPARHHKKHAKKHGKKKHGRNGASK